MVKIMNKKNNFLYKFFIKTFICLIIFLSLAIVCKKNNEYKEKIYNYIYQSNLDFSMFKKIYNKYLGGVLTKTKEEIQNDNYVFNESIKYDSFTKYESGVKLSVSNNYLVPNLKKGIVTYIGKKEKYDNVVIIQDEDGVDNWYGNICNTALKVYDNIEKNDYIGESCSDYIYLVFFKDNEFLDYNDYID